MTRIESIRQLRRPDPERPMPILFSACLTGLLCGYDGSSYGDFPVLTTLLQSPAVRVVRFCPEDYAFGTPREMCDIHGGTGADVLDGKARVLTESGIDWTEGMIRASLKMLETAMKNEVELAILMDTSAACGSQVIYDGNRFAADKKYQTGMGVCAAQLARHGIPVIAQRDYASLETLFEMLDPTYQADLSKKDHHQTEWYLDYFNMR
jgi:uncharacterized protein YbbK (DUF523 family)